MYFKQAREKQTLEEQKLMDGKNRTWFSTDRTLNEKMAMKQEEMKKEKKVGK